MKYVGLDPHRRFLVAAVEDERGRPRKPRRFACQDSEGIRRFFENVGPFQAVIEASSTYQWLY